MRNLISAELLKLRTTKSFWAYVASIVAFVPISIALSITVGNDQNPLTTSDGIRGVFSAPSSGLLMAVLIEQLANKVRHIHKHAAPGVARERTDHINARARGT